MDNENLIYVLNKQLALYQVSDGFRTSMDSIMLGAACPAINGQKILDLGCGVGSAGLCALKRIKKATLVGIDIQDDHIKLAKKNAKINEMADRSNFKIHDIRDMQLEETFDHVICNPPYMETGAHIHSPSKSKACAMGHMEENISIQSWITCAHKHIKGQGSLSLIHDAGQIDNIIHALFGRSGGKRFGAVEIIPLFPKKNMPAKRVIIRAYKHKKSKAILHSGIIMHESNGNHTKEANNILREMHSLFI